MSQLRSRSCPILIGRDTESALGAELLTQAAARRGAMLVIAGEAGVGKSRLTRGLIETATWRGFRHLIGYCHERDRDLPYAPFLDALHAALHRSDDLRRAQLLGAERAVLARLLPALATDDMALALPLAPEHEKRRIFEAFVALFARLAADAPLLLVIEDIHWADEASLDLLRLLARRLADTPVLIVATVRTNEPDTNLVHWLDYLERNRLVTRVNLAPLSAPDVTRMIAAMTDTLPPLAAVSIIQERAEGNPLLVEELLHAHQEAADTALGSHTEAVERYVPAMIAETVAHRLDTLDAETRRVAEMAAVIGQRFSFDVLRRLTRRTEGTLLIALRRLIAVYLIEEAPDDARDFVFRHALTRDAIYGRLLGPERQRFHRRIARALVAASEKRIAVSESELGYHAFLAEEWALAVEHCQRAGEQAQALYAPHAAVEHFSRALVAAGQLGGSQTDILLVRGQAYDWGGDFERARADYDTALAHARASDDRTTEWQALVSLGRIWATRDYERANCFLQAALDSATSIGDRARVARTLNNIGRFKPLIDRPSDAIPDYRQALAVFGSLDDTRGVGITLAYLGFAYHLSADLVRGAAYHRQAIARLRTINDRGGLIENLMALAERGPSLQTDWMVPATPRILDCLPEGEEALELARASGWRFGEAYSQSFLAFSHGAHGDYARAIGWAANGLAVGEEIGHRGLMFMTHGALGLLYLDLLVLPVAVQHLQRSFALAQELGAVHYANCAVGFLATAYLTSGEPERAATLIAEHLPPDLPRRTFSQRRIWLAQAELACAQGNPGRALDLIEEMIATAPNIDRTPSHCIPRLDLMRAEALAALGRDQDAARVLTTAIEVASAQGARPLLWRLQRALGALHDRHGRTREATRAFDDARLLIEDLAATVPDEHTSGTFLRHALATIPRSYRTASYQAIKQQYGGLTAREREVVTRVARGLTNREIADTLFIAEKTVELHVTHSLRKLGFRARTELATWAITAGLADVPPVARRTSTTR